MAKQIEGVTDTLLLCAKNEFLEKSFKDASLRVIAENAGTSTSSIYTRFKDKAGLFNAIVKSTADNFYQRYQEELDIFDKMAPMNWYEMLEYTDNQQNMLIDMIYDDFSAFKLLVCHAEGTVFSDFINNIVEYDVKYTIKYIESIGNNAIALKRLTPELLHMLCSSYWSGLFEIVVHDMSKEAANVYFHRLKRFFRCGWQDIFSGG
ncbi:TetR family transcriptional regulator [Ruminiclostridium sufflavum DSM 19573]|uniref:TetR family transcriptional regulator n=1 Tax=Ruminiclostridium sufflavum DSM 19573 TaxID=1121337 RepID=A0A318XKK1_9FIRM|nr:TetR/AcrR family transcriptional regulator [Ruminiclostridium sufflavum]PYG87965.1 TetR family transcriptional regulator [Ruminiclostridium sufflavum DSM 19573]